MSTDSSCRVPDFLRGVEERRPGDRIQHRHTVELRNI